MGRKNKNNNTVTAVAAIVVLLAVGLTAYSLSVSDGGDSPATGNVVQQDGVYYPQGVSSELYGKASSLSLAAYDKESSDNSQVNTTAYVWAQRFDPATGEFSEEKQYLGSATLTESARVDFTGATVGDKITVIAFDSTYPYGEEVSFVAQRTSEVENLDVYDGSGDVAITFYNEDGDTTTSVNVGAVPYSFEKIRIRNNDSYSRFVPRLVGFDYAETTNISSFTVSGLDSYTGAQIKRLKSVEDWFSISEETLNNAQINLDIGPVTVNPDGDDVNNETATMYVVDLAPFIDQENQLQYGVQDDAQDPADVGISDQSASITLA